MNVFVVLVSLQGIATLVDEFMFHHRRGLPRWERIGHPIDTALVLICLLFLSFAAHSLVNEIIYYSLVVVSSICITKDEWVHRKFCTAEEMWLHSVLFILHPLMLVSAAFNWDKHPDYITLATAGIFVFFVYQIVYWNFIEYRLHERNRVSKYRSHTDDELYDYFGE
ncbi:MAG: hypothetical protein ACM3MG_00305 [Bacillota bacterium]